MIAEGQVVGNYKILSKIGTGGMGAVFLAVHPLIGTRVALKVIHRELSTNKEVVQRFFQEARSVNQIGDEHIVEIHDFGQSEDGDYFYIMEYLEGRTLAFVMQQDRILGVTRAMHIAAQIASALGAAHTSGVVHRDLKPDNIMLIPRLGDPDFVKVLDFGLAKMSDGSMNLTAAGVVLGTPQYMSPEACESKKDVDHRTDVYALGVLLFQMVCGQLPFDGSSMGEVMIKQVTKPPPAPRAINANVPPALEQIILRCLAKQPDARFPTMYALRDALLDSDAYLASSPPMMRADIGRSVTEAGVTSMELNRGRNSRKASTADPVASGGRDLALPAPPVSVLAPNPASQPTVMAPRSRMMSSVPPPPAAPSHGPNAATMIAPAPALPPQGGELGYGPPPPRMTQPVPAQNHTMMIMTPVGHVNHPPTKHWPIVVLIVALVGVIAAGVIVVVRRHSRDVQARELLDRVSALAAKPSVPAASNPPLTTSDAAIATIDATAKITTVTIHVESQPDVAEVVDGKGAVVGHTPLELQVPRGDAPMALQIRVAGFAPETKTITPSADATIRVVLTAVPHHRGVGPGHPPAAPATHAVVPPVPAKVPPSTHKSGSGDDLMNPNDL